MSKRKTRNFLELQHLFVVTLKCGHKIVFRTPAPNVGERIACREHEWLMFPVTSLVPEYNSKCLNRTCQFYAHGRMDSTLAEKLGMSHMRDYPDHQTVLRQGNVIIRKIVNNLPVPGTARWHTTNPSHRGSLREFIERQST